MPLLIPEVPCLLHLGRMGYQFGRYQNLFEYFQETDISTDNELSFHVKHIAIIMNMSLLHRKIFLLIIEKSFYLINSNRFSEHSKYPPPQRKSI